MHLHCLWHCRVGQVRRPRGLCHKVLCSDGIPQTEQWCENLRPAKNPGEVHVHDGDTRVLLEQCEYISVQAAVGGGGCIGRERHPHGGDVCRRQGSITLQNWPPNILVSLGTRTFSSLSQSLTLANWPPNILVSLVM